MHKTYIGQKFVCYLNEDFYLPLQYIDGIIKVTFWLVEAPKEILTLYYNKLFYVI